MIILELILKNFFTPLQPRVTASVADLDMVRQCALEPYPPARPCHCTYLARYFQRLQTLARLSHVDRQPESMIQRSRRNTVLPDILARCAHCALARGGMQRSNGTCLRMHVTCFVRYLSRARERALAGWRM